MIKIKRDRSNQPDGFEDRRRGRDGEFAAARRTDPSVGASKYWARIRRQTSMAADADHLFRVFHRKCAYCEARPEHVSRLQVEHYRPKSNPSFENLLFSWENWLASCGRCNEAKWRHFPYCGKVPCLLDPTKDDPEEHVDFLDDRVVGKTERGRLTIEIVGLARSPLEDERATWLLLVQSLLLLFASEPDPVVEARELLVWAMQEDAPYCLMTRRYLQKWVPRLACPETPHAVVHAPDALERMRCLFVRHGSRLQLLE